MLLEERTRKQINIESSAGVCSKFIRRAGVLMKLKQSSFVIVWNMFVNVSRHGLSFCKCSLDCNNLLGILRSYGLISSIENNN